MRIWSPQTARQESPETPKRLPEGLPRDSEVIPGEIPRPIQDPPEIPLEGESVSGPKRRELGVPGAETLQNGENGLEQGPETIPIFVNFRSQVGVSECLRLGYRFGVPFGDSPQRLFHSFFASLSEAFFN